MEGQRFFEGYKESGMQKERRVNWVLEDFNIRTY
jgi:hypothetical protein